MRIAQIVPSLEERHGGPSKSVRSLATALARLGHDVDLLCTRPGADTGGRIEEGVRVFQFRRGWPAVICQSSGLRDHLRQNPYDYLHHHALWLRTLHYAEEARAAHGGRLVISPRGMLSDWSWIRRRWKKLLAAQWVHPGALEGADGWHATSVAESDEIRRRGFRQPVCVAPNGVEAPSAGDLAAARESWTGICPAAARRRIALFYSRFHRKKRLLELIDLWLDLSPDDWLLLVVGIPEEHTVEELVRLVHQRGAGDRIAVFDGRGRPPPYGLASLFLLPSHSENFGLVVAEAMAWGVPALVTDTTPWTEAAAHNAGWCVPWAGYRDTLRAALGESADRLEQRGASARNWVLQSFSWPQAAKTVAEFYAQLPARGA
jgi:glycosyltransferase involved in cell wall biosynthesis